MWLTPGPTPLLAGWLDGWLLTPPICVPACLRACRGNSLLEVLPDWMPEALPQLELLDVSACARLDLRSVAGLTQLQTLALQVGGRGARCWDTVTPDEMR